MGPTAVNSSLGWLLSDPVNGTMNGIETHSNLIISRSAEAYSIATDETHLVKTIERFWGTESIGNQGTILSGCRRFVHHECII